MEIIRFGKLVNNVCFAKNIVFKIKITFGSDLKRIRQYIPG